MNAQLASQTRIQFCSCVPFVFIAAIQATAADPSAHTEVQALVRKEVKVHKSADLEPVSAETGSINWAAEIAEHEKLLHLTYSSLDRQALGMQPVPAPKIPVALDKDSYEQYVKDLTDALKAPATEYRKLSQFSKLKPHLQGLSVAWPGFYGLKRQVEEMVDTNTAGDIYETGVWRGGTLIFMAAVTRAYERLLGKVSNRHFYGFDSFEGPMHLEEVADSKGAAFAGSLDLVKATFKRFGLLDDNIHLVKGFFHDTIPKHNIERPIALLRMDGDLYSSSLAVLQNFYPHIPTGAWIIVDDYDWSSTSKDKHCKDAVDEYRHQHDITAPIFGIQEYGQPSWKKV